MVIFVAVRPFIFILLLLTVHSIKGQTLGGNSVFNFLNLPNSPQLTALGGVNVSHPSNDPGMAFYNPALLNSSMHSRLNLVFNDFYAGITIFHLAYAYRNEKLKTNFLGGIQYFNYGTVPETDASGNILGNIHPNDWVIQVSASRQYLEKWNYGLTLKFIQSNYGQYRSSGLAADVGVNYYDTSQSLSVSLLARNMGVQIRSYNGTEPDDLPFDLQVGVTKRLKNAPFSFSATAHHLHHFDIAYPGSDNIDGTAKISSFDKLFRHFILAATIHAGERIEVQAAYNHLRRKELNISGAGNGLNGYSLGVAVLLPKLHIRYARSQYQNNTGYNQFGLSLPLNKYFGY